MVSSTVPLALLWVTRHALCALQNAIINTARTIAHASFTGAAHAKAVDNLLTIAPAQPYIKASTSFLSADCSPLQAKASSANAAPATHHAADDEDEDMINLFLSSITGPCACSLHAANVEPAEPSIAAAPLPNAAHAYFTGAAQIIPHEADEEEAIVQDFLDALRQPRLEHAQPPQTSPVSAIFSAAEEHEDIIKTFLSSIIAEPYECPLPRVDATPATLVAGDEAACTPYAADSFIPHAGPAINQAALAITPAEAAQLISSEAVPKVPPASATYPAEDNADSIMATFAVALKKQCSTSTTDFQQSKNNQAVSTTPLAIGLHTDKLSTDGAGNPPFEAADANVYFIGAAQPISPVAGNSMKKASRNAAPATAPLPNIAPSAENTTLLALMVACAETGHLPCTHTYAATAPDVILLSSAAPAIQPDADEDASLPCLH